MTRLFAITVPPNLRGPALSTYVNEQIMLYEKNQWQVVNIAVGVYDKSGTEVFVQVRR